MLFKYRIDGLNHQNSVVFRILILKLSNFSDTLRLPLFYWYSSPVRVFQFEQGSFWVFKINARLYNILDTKLTKTSHPKESIVLILIGSVWSGVDVKKKDSFNQHATTFVLNCSSEVGQNKHTKQ